jgi:hypothetical protein
MLQPSVIAAYAKIRLIPKALHALPLAFLPSRLKEFICHSGAGRNPGN